MHVFCSALLILYLLLIGAVVRLRFMGKYCAPDEQDIHPASTLDWMQRLLSCRRPRKGGSSPANTSSSGVYQRRQSVFGILPQQTGAIVFLGDSLIQTCEWSELLAGMLIQNRGIAGDTILTVLERLPTIVALKPSHIVLMVGINDLRQKTCKPLDALAVYDNILQRLKVELPDVTVLPHSVLPIHAHSFQTQFGKNGDDVNQKVESFNWGLRSLVKRYPCQYQYVDLATPLLDHTGQLKRLYTIDGLHLSGDAYMVWANLVKPLLGFERT